MAELSRVSLAPLPPLLYYNPYYGNDRKYILGIMECLESHVLGRLERSAQGCVFLAMAIVGHSHLALHLYLRHALS